MIYVHIPFCRSFCTYCGFYSVTAGRECGHEFEEYAARVAMEAAERREEILRTHGVNTLYIGGGTPSVLPLSCLDRIVSALPGGSYDEFTVEVNPDDVTGRGPAFADGLGRMGVNRISMGVQSFDDRVLRWMNRRHDADGARRAFRILRSGGISNISVDLIFGISGMDDVSWERTIDETLRIGQDCGGPPNHISAYQLSIEPDSALEKMVEKGDYQEASDEQCRRQYEILCRRLTAAGYRHYEVSNFALPGFEARHNSAYWRRAPYVGLGAGAHSFDGIRRRWNSELDGTGGYSSDSETLSPYDEQVERIMLSLRTSEGEDGEWLRSHVPDPAAVDRLIGEGALVAAGRMIRIPEDRFFVSDGIIRELV